MENETLFYILGIGLVVLALAVSAVGLRFERFPGSRAAQVGVVALFAVVVVGTAAFAWLEAEDEQQHQQEEELAEAAKANEAAGDEAEAQEEVGSGAATTTTTAGVDGSQVFNENGCGGCHTLSAAGSTGQIGPDLDGALQGKSADFIRTSIVDPSAVIAKNYPPGVMPESFGTDLSSDELDALVQYLAESTGAKTSGGSAGGGGGGPG